MQGRRKTAVMAMISAGLLVGVGACAGAMAAVAPGSWLCGVDKTTGFANDKTAKSWDITTCNCSPRPQELYPDGMMGTPASTARSASMAVNPCSRPVAMTLAAAA
jgi:hypothetical protein